MKIKRIISIILCLIMALSVVACSNTTDSEVTSSDELTNAPATTDAPDNTTVADETENLPVGTDNLPVETESPYDENGFLKSSLPEELNFGGLLGEGPIMEVNLSASPKKFIDRGGRIPAPMQSLKN